MKKALLTVIIVLTSLIAHAQTSVPPLINYQGMLTDTSGKALTGTHKLDFNLYDAAIGGNKVWGPQIFGSVPFVNGRFNVILSVADNGTDSIGDAFTSAERYIGVKVDDGQEISPRQRILSAPYAISAENANNSYLVQGYDLHEVIEELKAGKVLVDPSVKPVLPDADYESDWLSVSKGKTYNRIHGLGVYPRFAIIWGSASNRGTNRVLSERLSSKGCNLKDVTTTSYTIVTGQDSALNAGITNGYIKVLMWK